MIPVNMKYVLWILVFVAASLITVLFIDQVGINVGKLLSDIASPLFYAVSIAIVIYVISLVKRYVDCKVVESEKVIEMDAKIELLKREIKRIGAQVNEIAESHR